MQGISTSHAPKKYAVLPFYATAAFFFLVLSVLMFFAAERFQEHYFQGQTLALVHAAALGWGTMIIFGAAYQLLPVICEQNLYSSRIAFFSYFCLLFGSTFLIISFWIFNTGIVMILGGLLVLMAAILYFINVIKTTQIQKDTSIEIVFLFSSACWLFITVFIGVLLAINLAYPFFNKSHLEILKLHAHAGLAGWFLQLITGITVRLLPMFLLGKSSKKNLLKLSFIFQNIGLSGFIIDHYLFGSSYRVYLYILLAVVGIVCWLRYLYDVFKHRIKRKIDIQLKHTFISFLSLSIALLVLVLIVFFKNTTLNILYGSFLFLGWITALILGKTFKTLPFIIWNNHYNKLHGKTKIPLPKDLYNNNLLNYQFFFFISAMILLIAGVISNQLFIIKLGTLLWIVVAVLYVLNVVKLFLHQPAKLNE